VSGIGAGLSNLTSFPRLVAVQSEASPFLHSLYFRGTQDQIIEHPSLADGLAGPVEENSTTIPLVRSYVNDFILVSEEEIKDAIAVCWTSCHERIEGSAATALAAILTRKIQARPAVLIISGGNIDQSIFEHILARESTSNTER
jgi:threonine dehydratase